MYWMYQGVLFWMSYSCWAFLDRLSMYTSFFSPSPHAGSASLQLVGGEFHVLTTNLRGFQSPAVQFQAKVRLMQSIAWQHVRSLLTSRSNFSTASTTVFVSGNSALPGIQHVQADATLATRQHLSEGRSLIA